MNERGKPHRHIGCQMAHMTDAASNKNQLLSSGKRVVPPLFNVPLVLFAFVVIWGLGPAAAQQLQDPPSAPSHTGNLDAEGLPKRRSDGSCGCAKPRLVRQKGTVEIGPKTGLPVFGEQSPGSARPIWFHDDYLRTRQTSTHAADIPLVAEPFPAASDAKWLPQKQRFLQIRATAAYEDEFMIGMELAPGLLPKDIVRAKVGHSTETPLENSSGRRLDQLWLGPIQPVETGSCGARQHLDLAFETPEGQDRPIAFLVKRWREGRTDEEPEMAVLDSRHTGLFGLAYVPACEQGIPDIGKIPMTLQIEPIYWPQELGDPWIYEIGQKEGAFPVEIKRAASAGPIGIPNPFLVKRDIAAPSLGHDEDRVALVTMLILVAAAFLLAAGCWLLLRKKNKFPAEIVCIECSEHLQLELTDPAVDGMFCPGCGKVTVFVTIEPDGTPRARVLRLEESQK